MFTITHSDYTPFHIFLVGLGFLLGSILVLLGLKLKMVPEAKRKWVVAFRAVGFGLMILGRLT